MLDFQIPRITSRAGRRQPRLVHDRAARPRLRLHVRQLAAARAALSSLAGAAVTSVRIEGVAHEFSTIKGVKEDVTDIVLNLKGIVCRMHSDATEVEAPLVVTGPGEITAKDIDLPAGVEILNPDAHIATLEKKTKLELYLTIGRGRGYRPAEENKTPDQPIGVIPIDSIFSPVRRVAYSVEQARVGQRTDYDKLTLDIETDGSIDPQAALREAAEILISQLAIFTDADRIEELRAGPGGAARGRRPRSPAAAPRRRRGGGPMDDILIEELELGVRSYNCLKRAGIQTVGDLVSKSEAELNAIPNFGKKSIDEVIETLARARPGPAQGLDPLPRTAAMRHQKTRHKLSPHRLAPQGAARATSARRSSSTSGSRRARRRPRPSSRRSRSSSRSPSAATCTRAARRCRALGQDKFAVHKLFEEVAPRYAERPGGYTRILKLGPRRSDSTEMVYLELV